MKLKSLPSDFRVREVSQIRAQGGPYALYELHKTSLGTPEAVQAILRSWNLPRHQISYGGLKDRHAQTSQFITIHHGPKQDFEDRSFQLHYLGQTARAFHAKDIESNDFEILLRGIDGHRQSTITDRLLLIQRIGLVNYFDDQRFGSIGFGGRMIAEPWCQGDYEQTLYLAMAEENKHDRGREQQQKQILRDYWGKWQECKDRLDRSHRRSIVTFLCDHPTNFKRAVALIRSDLRSIYLAAFQSALWNQWLSKLIEVKFDDNVSYLNSVIGQLALPIIGSSDTSLLQWLGQLSLPLPTARQHEWPEDLVGLLDQVLERYGLERREIRLKYPRDTFFSKGIRPCWLKPSDFQYSWAHDELHSDRQALRLSFRLPRGAYATMLVKMLSE